MPKEDGRCPKRMRMESENVVVLESREQCLQEGNKAPLVSCPHGYGYQLWP